jgi:hypothetical protein
MMRFLAGLFAVGLVLAVAGTAGANTVTIQFDPDDLVTQASSTPYGQPNPLDRQQQASPKMYRANNNGLYFGSFYHPAFSGTNADFFDFRANNTISIPFFNMYIQSAADAQTGNWGQSITQNVAAPVPTATAASGWKSYVYPNPYGVPLGADPHGGYLVGWYNENYLTDRSNDLKSIGGNDHGLFTFTIDLNQNLLVGDTVRLWLGFYGLSSPENPPGGDFYAWTGDYTTTPSSLHVTNINAYEGVVYAKVIPEPVTMAGLMLGIGSLVGYVRKRRKA